VKRRIVLIVLTGFLGGLVNAQTRVLTFDEAVKIATKNYVLLNQQRNNLEYNHMQKISSIAGLGPTLSANASATQYNGNNFNSQTGKLVVGLLNNVAGSLNANVNVFNGFSQVNRVRQYTSLEEAQSYYINRSIQDAINTVSQQYLQVLLDGELLRIANENLLAQKKQLDQIMESVTLGARSPVDQYNQDSQTKAAEIKALQAQVTLISDKALLTFTLLLDPLDPFDVAKPAWDVNKLSADNMPIDGLIQTGLQTRGDYLRAVKNEESSKYGMIATKATMLPTLSVYGSIYSAYNNPIGSNPPVPSFENQFRQINLKKYYGAQIYIPIFGGSQNLQNRTNYVQQKILYLNNQVTRKNVEIQVKTDVLRAWESYDVFKKIFSATEGQLAAAEIAYQLETERYNLGITNFVDYTNANRNFVQAQTDKAQAEYRLLFQKVALDYAVGTLVPENLQ
jgi:outer membrane protein